jgi:hypothetical protein
MPYNPGVQDISGQLYGQGIERAAQGFTKGVQEYWRKKEEKERENEFVGWMKGNAQKMGLPITGDDAEDDKMIRAGYKAVGPQQMMAFTQYLQEKEAREQEAQAREEMRQAQIAQMSAHTDQVRAMMAERETEGSAVRAAFDPSAGTAQQIMQGRSFEQLEPTGEVDRGEAYMRAGGRDPQMAKALMRERAWEPRKIQLDDEDAVIMTSPHSAVPAPSSRPKKLKSAEPEKSADGKFYRSGPEDDWKPVPSERDDDRPLTVNEFLMSPTLSTKYGDDYGRYREAFAAAAKRGGGAPSADSAPNAKGALPTLEEIRAERERRKQAGK